MSHCRICLEEERPFVHPCLCKGSTGNVHAECLAKWIHESGHTECEICHAEYNTDNVCSLNMPSVVANTFQLDYHPILCRICITIFCTTCFWCVLLGYDFFVAAPYGATPFYLLMLGLLSCKYQVDMKIVMDYAFLWKAAFTIPFMIMNLMFQYHLLSQCEYVCTTISKTSCDVSCNFYGAYDRKIDRMIMSIYIEMIAVVVLLTIRSIYICTTYNRNRVFSNFSETVTDSGSGSEGSPDTIV